MIAIILAGGKGTRLRPYTTSLPKPLMPVGDHPILEIVIKQLKNAGVSRVVIAVGYLESLIKAFFGDGSHFGVEINYSSEPIPLGTAGPLSLLKHELNETFILMNGDVLSDIDFHNLLEFHKREQGIASIAVTKRNVKIDFGVIEIGHDNRFQKWREKPSLEYLVSTGIYMFEPRVTEFLPDGYLNLPDLIIKLHELGERVSTYLHNGYWLDIGRIDDYEAACNAVEEKKVDFGFQ